MKNSKAKEAREGQKNRWSRMEKVARGILLGPRTCHFIKTCIIQTLFKYCIGLIDCLIFHLLPSSFIVLFFNSCFLVSSMHYYMHSRIVVVADTIFSRAVSVLSVKFFIFFSLFLCLVSSDKDFLYIILFIFVYNKIM